MVNLPEINWIKNDPEKYCLFVDGSKFLVALQVRNNKTKITKWDFEVVVTNCDGEDMSLMTSEGEYFSGWQWIDFDYFCLLDGEMPTAERVDE